jgi:hypothetical protein
VILVHESINTAWLLSCAPVFRSSALWFFFYSSWHGYEGFLVASSLKNTYQTQDKDFCKCFQQRHNHCIYCMNSHLRGQYGIQAKCSYHRENIVQKWFHHPTYDNTVTCISD